jgi:hypothetical protein
MSSVFQGITEGAKEYRDLATGELKTLSTNLKDAFGIPVEDSEQVEAKQGETTVLEEAQLPGKSTIYNDPGPSSSPIAAGGSSVTSATEPVQGQKYVTDANGTGNKETIDPGRARLSAFNGWNLFRYKSKALGNLEDNNNVPEYNVAENKEKSRLLNPTAKSIIEWSGDSQSDGCVYSNRDFIQCEHYGMIPNNYMVTLRRFPFPAPDDIFNPKSFSSEKQQFIETGQPDIARAITWMSPTLGNELKDIFSFDVGFNWKDIEAGVQTAQSSTDRGSVGSFMESNPLLRAIEAGNEGLDPVTARRKAELGAGFDPLSATYPNHVYGPLNVIKSMMVRDRGIKFDKEFTLSFYYDMKAYGNTSPKAAFLDTLTNLLVLTTNNAPFWGGAARGVSNGKIGKPFGDMDKLASGDYLGFFSGVADTFSSTASNVLGEITDAVTSGGKEIGPMLNNLVGGQLMDLFGSPQGATVLNAFLTGDPTGQWHLTVGNPMNPAMVIGNLGLQNAKFEFEGPLGYEDFPTKLKVTVTLKPGRPRDKSEIESMFNTGKGRMYILPEGTKDVAFINKSAYGNKDTKNMNAGIVTRAQESSLG